MTKLVWHCGYGQYYSNDSVYVYVVTQVEHHDEYYWTAAYRVIEEYDVLNDNEHECTCHHYQPVPGPFSTTRRQAMANAQAFSEGMR